MKRELVRSEYTVREPKAAARIAQTIRADFCFRISQDRSHLEHTSA